jgi:hypothetical protein
LSSSAPVVHGESSGKARGRWSSQGGSASSRRQRWISMRVLCGSDDGVLADGDDGVLASGDPGEVLRLGGGTQSLGTSLSKKKRAWGGAHLRTGKATTFWSNPGKTALHRSSRVAEGVISRGGRWRATLLREREWRGQKGGGWGHSVVAMPKWGGGVWCVTQKGDS